MTPENIVSCNKNDFHIHTSISPCASPEASVASYIEAAHKLNFSKVGFCNHFWDELIRREEMYYYEPLTTSCLLAIKDEIPGKDELNIFVGCEAEMILDNSVTLMPEHAHLFDYALIPTTHFNIKDVCIASSVKKPAEVGKLMVERFIAAATSELSKVIRTAICHPFMPYGFFEVGDEILSGITDSEYEYCFSTAAGLGIPVEVNGRVFQVKQLELDPSTGFPYQFLRIMTIARECGCKIYPGSDSHHADNLTHLHGNRLFDRFADACKITFSELL